jgi:hypothetical protein
MMEMNPARRRLRWFLPKPEALMEKELHLVILILYGVLAGLVLGGIWYFCFNLFFCSLLQCKLLYLRHTQELTHTQYTNAHTQISYAVGATFFACIMFYNTTVGFVFLLPVRKCRCNDHISAIVYVVLTSLHIITRTKHNT